MKLSSKIERVAQRLYDIRDALPSHDTRTWKDLDRKATAVSVLAGRLKTEGQ